MATQYTQGYSDFIGIDLSSDPCNVTRNRLAYAVNMWRDYESEQGGAIETFPGFRRVFELRNVDGAKLHGLFNYRSRTGTDYVVVHLGTELYSIKLSSLISGELEEGEPKRITTDTLKMADNDSASFLYNNKLHLLDGKKYYVVDIEGDGAEAGMKEALSSSYIPTITLNGKDYEQRNMLSNECYIQESSTAFNASGSSANYYLDGTSMFVTDPILYSQTVTKNNVTYHWRTQRITGIKDEWFASCLMYYSLNYGFDATKNLFDSQEKADILSSLHICCSNRVVIQSWAFARCNNLKEVDIRLLSSGSGTYEVIIEEGAFANTAIAAGLKINISSANAEAITLTSPDSLKDNISLITDTSNTDYVSYRFNKYIAFSSPVSSIKSILKNGNKGDVLKYAYIMTNKGEENEAIEKVYIQDLANDTTMIKIHAVLKESYFGTVGKMLSFKDGNPEYTGTTEDAINFCTKCAVYDGRIFLTGNPALPNTVFYSQRNLTGATDPTYFGVYNYFNDGDGNNPNVDLLSIPSMLMVLKNDTVQDGSIYYHVGTDNASEDSRDIIPRLYPSTRGAAGLGSAGSTFPATISCNFLDDPVFLSKRGLEGVDKETVNLERTIGHRSGNVDRLLLKEDLSSACLAEWKGYLVICCDGRIYLADSRYRTLHNDGSYQYEWYYLEGIGTYDSYVPRWGFWLDSWPLIELEGVEAMTLDSFVTLDGDRVGDLLSLHESGDVPEGSTIMSMTVQHPDESITLDLHFVTLDGISYVINIKGDEKIGVGSFHGARRVLSVGERLIFATDNGDICIVNTDKRGVSVDGRDVEHDRIDRSFYSFNGVAYRSGCAVRLDDCGKKALTKTTVCGTTTARFKMMPGSQCTVNISFNGRDWQYLGEAHSSRFDFADIQFSNFSFAENENNIVVFPEISRRWVNKQYYFYSDAYEAPFGLYGLSYLYYVSGKIRY